MLRYPDFAAQGYPLGSGAAESACKLVAGKPTPRPPWRRPLYARNAQQQAS